MRQITRMATYLTGLMQNDFEKFFYNKSDHKCHGAGSLSHSWGLFRQHSLSYWNYILVSSEVYIVTSRHFWVWGFILFIMVRTQDTEFVSLAWIQTSGLKLQWLPLQRGEERLKSVCNTVSVIGQKGRRQPMATAFPLL